jgi:sortase (surface protein transpeptidase)
MVYHGDRIYMTVSNSPYDYGTYPIDTTAPGNLEP